MDEFDPLKGLLSLPDSKILLLSIKQDAVLVLERKLKN